MESVRLGNERVQRHVVPFYLPLVNPLVKGLLRLGMPMGPMRLLSVRGRKSGRERRTPVAILDNNGNRYIVSVYGMSQWVRNLRAEGEGKLRKRWRSQSIRVVELSPKDAAPILMVGLAKAPSFLKKYFETTADSSMEEFERDAVHHPVFKIEENAGRPA